MKERRQSMASYNFSSSIEMPTSSGEFFDNNNNVYKNTISHNYGSPSIHVSELVKSNYHFYFCLQQILFYEKVGEASTDLNSFCSAVRRRPTNVHS
jgi:hypothetical protein